MAVHACSASKKALLKKINLIIRNMNEYTEASLDLLIVCAAPSKNQLSLVKEEIDEKTKSMN